MWIITSIGLYYIVELDSLESSLLGILWPFWLIVAIISIPFALVHLIIEFIDARY